ncbi:hypothetical protein ACOQFV_30850 [Nocardiopsis changdeensis]|uniref:Toxin-antitoxin system HicB family antitoxin n=1 Tax=Nocardiopsis changdeensis TaxID=2831969 RepID=A0ABX8BSK8_9ACTN|nr:MULTISPECIES: hypothetical protein [Nocardiopsis]QUX25096.1 hypothetical protein KGD84_13035 [Nocardiopsis changdeensis]QYX35482.1 hypothetical protein K1J57_22485 [Nocardiopsis sp. MT53]
MDLTSYVAALRDELALAAEAGGDDARALAERLVAPLDSAARLMLLNVLSDAMAEVTRELAPGSVDVRLRGRDPEFVVTPPPPEPEAADVRAARPLPPAPPADTEGEGGTARVNLRLPAHLKGRLDTAAEQEGLSTNAWLVRVVAAALDPADLPASRARGGGRESFTGWVR